jgi:hypothetical protein
LATRNYSSLAPLQYDDSMKFGYHTSHYNQQFSKQKEEKFTEVFSAITSCMNELVKSGVAPSDVEVQAEVAKHYAYDALVIWADTNLKE